MPILLMNRYCNFLCNTESIHHELAGCKNVIADSKLDSRFIPRSRWILTIPLFFPQKFFSYSIQFAPQSGSGSFVS